MSKMKKNMKIQNTLEKVGLWSNSEYSNALIWQNVDHLTPVQRLNDKSIKIPTATIIF